MANALVEALRQEESGKTESAETAYARLVDAYVLEEEVPSRKSFSILEAAGKSIDDLEADVAKVETRAALIVKASQEDEAREELKACILERTKLDAELEAATKAHRDATRQLDERQRAGSVKLNQAVQAKTTLINTPGAGRDAYLKARESHKAANKRRADVEHRLKEAKSFLSDAQRDLKAERDDAKKAAAEARVTSCVADVERAEADLRAVVETIARFAADIEEAKAAMLA